MIFYKFLDKDQSVEIMKKVTRGGCFQKIK